jgi:hypothetical protein
MRRRRSHLPLLRGCVPYPRADTHGYSAPQEEQTKTPGENREHENAEDEKPTHMLRLEAAHDSAGHTPGFRRTGAAAGQSEDRPLRILPAPCCLLPAI